MMLASCFSLFVSLSNMAWIVCFSLACAIQRASDISYSVVEPSRDPKATNLPPSFSILIQCRPVSPTGIERVGSFCLYKKSHTSKTPFIFVVKKTPARVGDQQPSVR